MKIKINEMAFDGINFTLTPENEEEKETLETLFENRDTQMIVAVERVKRSGRVWFRSNETGLMPQLTEKEKDARSKKRPRERFCGL